MIRAGSVCLVVATIVGLGLSPPACSLLLNDDPVQCHGDSDCARFSGTMCDHLDGVCVPRVLVLGSGGQGGPGGADGRAGPGGGPMLSSGGGASGQGGSPATGSAGGMGNSGGSRPGTTMIACPDLDGNGVRDCTESLIANGDFATGVAGWAAEQGTTNAFSTNDGEDAAQSGSLLVTNTAQSSVATGLTMAGSSICLPDVTATSYSVYLEVSVAPVAGGLAQAGITFSYYASGDCSGTASGIAPTSLVDQSMEGWTLVPETIFPSNGTRSMLVRLVVVKPFNQPSAQAWFDNLLIRAN